MNKYRIGTDVPFQLSVDDGVEYLDLSKCTILNVAMYCDAQEAFAGPCTWSVNEDNHSRLDCVYPGDRQVYAGKMRVVVVMVDAEGGKKAYDLKDIFEIVENTEQANATEEDVTSAVLSAWQLPMSTLATIVEAAINATEAATESAIAEISYTASAEDDGYNVLHITQEDGTTHDFNIKNGATGPQGEQGEVGPQGEQGPQGNPGSSQDYPFELENNLVDGSTNKALTGAMGKQLKDDVDQLDAEVHNFKGACYGVFETADDLPEDAVKKGYAYVGSVSPFEVYNFDGNSWSDSGVTTFEAVITAEDLGEEVQAINLGPNVQYVEQNLTTAQKSQARMNIGAGTSDFTGNYNDLSNKPTIPELSTDVETDKTSDTKSSTPKSVYDFVMEVINAKLSDYYTKAQIDDIVLDLKFPDEYQRVEYLQTDGTAYIDLGVNNKTTFGVRAKASNITLGTKNFTCGAGKGDLAGIGVRIGKDNVSYCAQRQMNMVSYASGSAENKYVQANFNASGKGYVEGMETATTVTLDSFAFANTSYTFLVFAVHNYQGNVVLQSGSGYRLHHLQISDGATLVFDLYPCYRKLDNEAGLYDMVSGTFFGNAAGSGAFTAGSEL